MAEFMTVTIIEKPVTEVVFGSKRWSLGEGGNERKAGDFLLRINPRAVWTWKLVGTVAVATQVRVSRATRRLDFDGARARLDKLAAREEKGARS